MKLIKKIYWSTIIFLGLAGPALAVQRISPPSGEAIDLNLIETWITDIVNFILRAGSLLAVGYIVLAGIKWMTAGGDDTKVGEAKTALTNGIIGAAVILGVYVILKTIQAFFASGEL
jgi:hypothetical protein